MIGFCIGFWGGWGVRDFFGVWMILDTNERAVACIGVLDEIVRKHTARSYGKCLDVKNIYNKTIPKNNV